MMKIYYYSEMKVITLLTLPLTSIIKMIEVFETVFFKGKTLLPIAAFNQFAAHFKLICQVCSAASNMSGVQTSVVSFGSTAAG